MGEFQTSATLLSSRFVRQPATSIFYYIKDTKRSHFPKWSRLIQCPMRRLYHSAQIQEHCPVFFNLLKKCHQTVLPRVISPNIINKVYELRILATFPEGRYPCTVFLRAALDCVSCGLERLDYFPTESPRAHNSTRQPS